MCVVRSLQRKKMKLYNIYYNGRYDSGGRPTYEGTTHLSPKEWLKQHNKEREKPEGLEEFDFKEVQVDQDRAAK